MKRIASLVSAFTLALLLSACAAPGAQSGAVEIQRGVIQQISATQIATNHHQGLGADQAANTEPAQTTDDGAGTGRDVAMVVGAIGGAVIGNEVQKKHDQPIAGQQIIVRLSSGVLVQVTQPVGPSLRVGQNVYVEGSGENARVVPQ
jgi:outer membrane lipoprotein SlyB